MRWESIKELGSKWSDDQSMAAVRAGGSWEFRNPAVVSGSLKPALKSLSCGWCMIGKRGYHSKRSGTRQNDKYSKVHVYRNSFAFQQENVERIGQDQTMHSFVYDWRALPWPVGTGPDEADWGDRVGGLRGVAWGHSRTADEDVGVPGGRAPLPSGRGDEPSTRRPSRHCSRVRWPRFS